MVGYGVVVGRKGVDRRGKFRDNVRVIGWEEKGLQEYERVAGVKVSESGSAVLCPG